MTFYNWRGGEDSAWSGVFGHRCSGAVSPRGCGHGSSVTSWLWTQILVRCCLDSDLGSFIYCLCDLGFYLSPWYLSFLIYKNGEKYVTWIVKGSDKFLYTKCLEQCPAPRKHSAANFGTCRFQSLFCHSLEAWLSGFTRQNRQRKEQRIWSQRVPILWLETS